MRSRKASRDLSGAGVAIAFACVAVVLTPQSAEAQGPGKREYLRMQESLLGPEKSLGSEGMQWQVADARFFLDDGTVRWMEPVSGQSTGLLFSGSGRFQLGVQHVAELRQLRRFAEDPGIEGLSFDFKAMTLRGVGIEALASVEPEVTAAGPFKQTSRFSDEMEGWLRHSRTDADARVIAALRNPGDRFVQAEFETEEYGRVIFQYDEGEPEEITVFKLKEGQAESWLSLDRPDQRNDDGSPNSRWTDDLLSLVALDAKVDVTEPGKGRARGVGQVNPVKAVYSATGRFRSKANGVSVLRLNLTPWAEVISVTDASGSPVEFMRFHVGGLSRSVPNELYDSALTVVLDESLAADEEISLRFDYQLEMANFASLRSWYPNPVGSGFQDSHATRLEVTHRKDYDVRAMGKLVEQRKEGRTVVSVWETDQPVDSAAFTIARLPHQETFEHEGLPKIHMFGTQAGSMSKEKIAQWAPDVINAVNFFQNLFGTKVGADELTMTFIASGHGQAGEGFIHISDGIAQYRGGASAGATEAFLAHEIAHEWWGHQLTWASYRDQWLSEGIAQYSAMMFVEASLEKGPKIVADMVQAYHDEINGSIKSLFGAFARPGLALLNKAGRERIGPIGHGYRSGTAENPAAYQSMAYTKGALVMHSLRSILRTMTKNDDLFRRIMRDFVATHHGGEVRTEDFLAVIQKHAGSSYWPFFIDQFVYSNDIPTLKWSHSTKQNGDQWVLIVDVEQQEVPDGFRTAVPLRAEFGRGQQGDMLLMLDAPTKHFELNMPSKPTKVELNPGRAVLANVE